MRTAIWRLAPLVGTTLSAAALLFPGGQALAQMPPTAATPLGTMFGGGLHAYFTGDYDRVLRDLGDVIAAASSPASKDPRWYYFRGLAALKLGRLDEAEADFSEGAILEARSQGNWPVSQSLERVQGAERLQLERHRARARVAMLRRKAEVQGLQPVQQQQGEPELLRQKRPLPDGGDDEANPFGTSEPSREAETLPAPETPPAAEPGADASAEPEPAAAEPRPTEPLELPGERPLTPERDDSDPFGDAPARDSDPTMSTERAAQKDEQAEALAAEADTSSDQIDQRSEQEAAAAGDAASQRDGQMEAEAAGQ